MALVSILIPTFNQAGYIGQAVKSALQQDWPELEVVVSDDGSSDDTQHVLEKYHDDERVRLSRNAENLGRVGNYRKCLYELANGDWALILDGDDYLIDSSYISKAMSLAQADSTIFPSRVIETWFDNMIFRHADVNVRRLIRSGDDEGRRRYMRELKKINPRVYARIRRQPRIILKRLKCAVVNRWSHNGVDSGAK
jgi:glycosyltransferase involved in cell wall biosynthesis